MKKKNKSVGGRLFYTFGTVFLAAIITVCAMNFARDARVLQSPALSAVSEKSPSVKAGTDSQGYKTLKYNKSSSSSGRTKYKNSTGSSSHKSTTNTSNPGNNP